MNRNHGLYDDSSIIGFNESELDKFVNPIYDEKQEPNENCTGDAEKTFEFPPAKQSYGKEHSPPSTQRTFLKDYKKEHFARLGSYAQLLWSDNLITDITIKVNDYSFNAHRAVLACFSSTLKKKLAQVNTQTVQLSGIRPGILRILLNYMYTGELNITCQTLPDVFCGAKQLEMKDVVTKCAEKLRGGDSDMDSFWFVYISALKLGLCEKARKAYERILQNFEECMRSKEFLHLTFDQLCNILRSDAIAVRSELVVYLAAMKWLAHGNETREKYSVQVLECIRFPLMREVEILYCFNPPVAKHITKNPYVRFILLHALCYSAATRYGLEKFFKNFGCKSRTQMLPGEITELWDFDENDVCPNISYSVILPSESSVSALGSKPSLLRTKTKSSFAY